MTRGNEISEAIRNQIVGMRRAGMTFEAIGGEFNLNKDTVAKIYKRWEERGTCENDPRSGRPKILGKHDVRRIKAHITTNCETRRQPLGEIINTLNLPISTDTLHSTIVNHIRLNRRVERKRCFLSLENMKARLTFAKQYIHWGTEEWRRCGFTDEIALQTDSNQGRKFVWRFPGEEYNRDCIRGTVISGFRSIKVWGAMRYGKLSKLVIFPEREAGSGRLTALEYRDIIMDGEMFDFWMEGMEDVGYLVMMEDGAPQHQGAAAVRRTQLEKDGCVGCGPKTWPANSPDLNPIENLWHILKANIRKRKRQPRTREELIEAALEEWENLDMELVNNLIDSMPRRMQAVIKAKGGPTGY
jgi:transposase